MLNLRFAFDDAITAISEFADELKIPSLPAAVFLMQGDVLNSYGHALTHYLTVPLSSHFLQNSSLGTPYQKWSHVTNENFGMLSFAVRNLLRYSSRLFHESIAQALRDQRRFEGFATRSNAYTSPIWEMRTRGEIGIVVRPDEQLEIRSIRNEPPSVKVGWRNSKGTPPVYFRVDEGSQPPREVEIEQGEYMDILATIRTETVTISDRSRLLAIQERGMAELEVLKKLHLKFAEACRAHLGQLDAFSPFDRLNESYWI